MRFLTKHPSSLATRAIGVDRFLGLIIGIAIAFLTSAWFLPMMSVQRFIFWQDELSFAVALLELAESGETGLFAILFIFYRNKAIAFTRQLKRFTLKLGVS